MHTSKVLNTLELNASVFSLVVEKPNKIWGGISNCDVCLFDINGNETVGVMVIGVNR
jgi:hypothetical protein